MVARKQRTPVVLDTNVFVRSFKTRDGQSLNRRIVRLWLIERRLQLVVTPEVVAEYLEIFENVVRLERSDLELWRERLHFDPRVTNVNPGRHWVRSRDPDDDAFLTAASAGSVKYLVTNDLDLLDLSDADRRGLRFSIVTPGEFLGAIERQ